MKRLNTSISDRNMEILDLLSNEMDITKKSLVNIALREFLVRLGFIEDVLKNPSLQ